MRKAVVLFTVAVLSFAQAKELPYKLFVRTFSSPTNPNVDIVYKDVKNILKDKDNLRVVKRPSGKYHVVVVETVMEKSEFKKLARDLKKNPKYKDAFYLPAPELLDEKGGLVSEDVAKTEEEPTEEVVTEKTILLEEDQKTTSSSNSGALTLNQTVEALLEKSPKIKERVYNYIETGKELDIADQGYYPTLNLNASYGIGRDKVNRGNDRDWQKSETKNAELRLVENLFNGGATSNNIDQARSRMRNASYLVIERADRTVLGTVDAYLNVVKEKKLLDLSSENVATLEGIYGQIKQRTESGFGISSEKQQAASRLTLAQSNYIAQQNAYQDALATFQKLTGTAVSAAQLSYPEFVLSLPKSQKELEDKAFVCNPTIRAEAANVQLAKHVYKGSNAAFLPKLDLEAYAGISQTDNFAFDDQRVDSYGALLRFSYNLYNKGSDLTMKEKRRVGIQKEQEILESTKRDLHESLSFSWQSYVLNNKKLGYLADHATFSRETLYNYKEEFKIGRRQLINVLDAENEYYNAQKEIARVKKDLLYAKYRILDNMGLITESFKPGFGKKYVKDACGLNADM